MKKVRIPESLKSPSLVLLVISLIYVGFTGISVHTMGVILGICTLYGLEIGLKGLKMYLEANKKEEKQQSKLELLQEEIKIEEANIRLEKTKKREVGSVGFGNGMPDNLSF